ncbi:unnamed protein product [Microthlaspi erraticum]|uniref:Uncharacterized protein n=1 Tax=Microthlaspi erraticum TaxID=1685480 RepID=A0A6D2L1Y4_9BRAS|nr:unnamed protein product [Microthlaspi erraticum]
MPKHECGLGFKDLHCFNLALLAKQAWRILRNPNSLLARIYRGRYHKSSTFLESVGGGNPSYGWRSIQAGKNLLRKGLRVRIDNRKETSVWDDHWLPVLPPRLATRRLPPSQMKVEQLWKPGLGEWDDAALTSVLTPEDVELAKMIRLSRYTTTDDYFWAYNSNGEYNVKSCYWVATHIVPNGEQIEPPPGSLDLKKACGR